MLESTEVISLLLATGVLVFLYAYRSQLRTIPAFWCLSLGFISFFASLVATVLEGYALQDFLNVVEHILNLASTIFLVAWILLACSSKGRNSWPS